VRLAVLALLTLIGYGVLSLPAADAHTPTTVVHQVSGAPRIGVVGDSALAGVRWYGEFGALGDFSYVFDAESCRRTIETSCWSREGYRAENAVSTLQRLSGQWGDVLVVMSGYNDPSYGFDEGIDAVVDEARRQGIPRVVWLTLRVADVSYEEPLHQANGRTYRESNEVLLDRAGELDGYLQVADWATASSAHDEWFEPDGIHLKNGAGTKGLTTFIAEQVRQVLAGASITPAAAPWYTLREGDTGDRVKTLQQALVTAGYPLQGGADGVFGPSTAAAVVLFQQRSRLDVTGAVDESTAVALSLRPAAPGSPVAPSVDERTSPATPSLRPVAPAADDAREASALGAAAPWLAVPAVVALAVALLRARVHLRRRAQRRRRSPLPAR